MINMVYDVRLPFTRSLLNKYTEMVQIQILKIKFGWMGSPFYFSSILRGGITFVTSYLLP